MHDKSNWLCLVLNMNCAIKNLLISDSFRKIRRANIGLEGERRLQRAMRRTALFCNTTSLCNAAALAAPQTMLQYEKKDISWYDKVIIKQFEARCI